MPLLFELGGVQKANIPFIVDYQQSGHVVSSRPGWASKNSV
jgi:hypothetical protein